MLPSDAAGVYSSSRLHTNIFQTSVERLIRYLMAYAIMQINLGCNFLRQVAEADLEQPALHLHSKGSIFTAIIPAQDVRESCCSSCGAPHSLAVHSARCAATQAGTRSALVQSGGGEHHPCITLSDSSITDYSG